MIAMTMMKGTMMNAPAVKASLVAMMPRQPAHPETKSCVSSTSAGARREPPALVSRDPCGQKREKLELVQRDSRCAGVCWHWLGKSTGLLRTR
mmetsp:Transcript_10060/g.23474  ORF Transcript_10060/g.23474 Transcript_10060/m.23474 type:complete len:93 (+) Transcript_10060:434-712(+)